jgi:hypothetical protein
MECRTGQAFFGREEAMAEVKVALRQITLAKVLRNGGGMKNGGLFSTFRLHSATVSQGHEPAGAHPRAAAGLART